MKQIGLELIIKRLFDSFCMPFGGLSKISLVIENKMLLIFMEIELFNFRFLRLFVCSAVYEKNGKKLQL